MWSHRGHNPSDLEHLKSVVGTIDQFNAVTFRVTSTILEQPNMTSAERVAIIERWIDIAQVFILNIYFRIAYSTFDHEILSYWVRLRGINAHSVSPQPASYLVPILLLGEHEHQSFSSLAINQKVGGLGNRTGDPPIPGLSLNHTTTCPLGI